MAARMSTDLSSRIKPALQIKAGESRSVGPRNRIVPIPREELQVGKQQVQSAKVYHVSTTVVEVPVEEQVKLRAETVVIERRPTTRTTVRGRE